MIEKIIAGGQTGVDQAALTIAKELNFEIGGWCPRGGLDEKNFNILLSFPSLRETNTSEPKERTQLNIQDSDGTLILVNQWPLPEDIKDGTPFTYHYAKQIKKPCFIAIMTNKEYDTTTIKDWIMENRIYILNIAGPRESNAPGIFNDASTFISTLLNEMVQLKPHL